MHGTRVYSAAEIKAACEAIWNDRKLRSSTNILYWMHFEYSSIDLGGRKLGAHGYKENRVMFWYIGRAAQFKDYRQAQLRRIRKHQVYGQSN